VIYKNGKAAKELSESFDRFTLLRLERRAAEREGRLVTIGPLILFSTDTGDAWLLDPADHLAARSARDGDPEPIYFEETDTSFAIGWKGNYSIDGDAFIDGDRDSGRMVTTLGYLTAALLGWADFGISKHVCRSSG